jgi:hypothetical protein
VLPYLAKGKSLKLKATLAKEAPLAKGGIAGKDHPGLHTDLLLEKRNVRTYHYERYDPSTPDIDFGYIRSSMIFIPSKATVL